MITTVVHKSFTVRKTVTSDLDRREAVLAVLGEVEDILGSSQFEVKLHVGRSYGPAGTPSKGWTVTATYARP